MKKPTRKAPLAAGLVDRPKRGRHTIPDNFLSGARDNWAFLLEQCWPEIGWALLCIRDRRTSTIEDIRTIFELVKRKPHNPGIAAHLYRETCEPATAAEVCRNRIRCGKLTAQIYKVQPKRNEKEHRWREAVSVLQTAAPGEREAIHEAVSQRQAQFLEADAELRTLTDEFNGLSKKVSDQEAYVSRTELLDFLQSRRYAANPRNLANALAGLPTMKWRQSYVRCARIPFSSEPSFEYQVMGVISAIWNRRRSEFKEPPLAYFRDQLLQLPKTLAYSHQFLRNNWSDMKVALQECWKEKPNPASVPFVLSAAFLRLATRQKNATERILAERDKLAE